MNDLKGKMTATVTRKTTISEIDLCVMILAAVGPEIKIVFNASLTVDNSFVCELDVFKEIRQKVKVHLGGAQTNTSTARDGKHCNVWVKYKKVSPGTSKLHNPAGYNQLNMDGTLKH